MFAQTNISEARGEPAIQMASCLNDVQRRIYKARDAVTDVARGVCKGVKGMIRKIMCSCDDSCVGEVGEHAAA